LGTIPASVRFPAAKAQGNKPMLRALGLIGGFVLLTAATTPPPPQLQKAFAGTIVSTYPDGRKAELWLNPDGSYISEGRRHDRHSGHWRLKGEKVCFSRLVFSYCTAIPDGNAFTAKAVTGETIHVRLQPGRQGAKTG
jgi:hypothetical protein